MRQAAFEGWVPYYLISNRKTDDHLSGLLLRISELRKWVSLKSHFTLIFY